MNAEPLLHIAPAGQWEEAQLDGVYRGDTLAGEGFIHCSSPGQVLRVAQARFAGRRDLVLLYIDPARVQAPIRYEAAETEEQFPHVYGALNLEAVVRVVPFAPDRDGRFRLPEVAPHPP